MHCTCIARALTVLPPLFHPSALHDECALNAYAFTHECVRIAYAFADTPQCTCIARAFTVFYRSTHPTYREQAQGFDAQVPDAATAKTAWAQCCARYTPALVSKVLFDQEFSPPGPTTD